ncbi:hypothetical protein C2E21_2315 [Chlorella sorokiniana]|uniref:Uncharacterized protein n=1 Tax=Chlorella sorokiniana TaxID=3076 RepID=A0A2P6TYT8_CHLSO|nr:hypothetical protein C2E21_2315 [Chlorella sorokiniana]|eukprot:PRW59200.1 hypothetical protein C2E21_2315 [Chlorella sorokiniana]
MAAARTGTPWVSRAGQRHELGAYKHEAQAQLATDLANLLQAHFLARDSGAPQLQPELSMLPEASLEDLAEREEWVELCSEPSLDQAIQQLAESRLAEQLYYDLFSVETSDDDDMEAEQAVSQPQQQPQQQPAQQQQQQQQAHQEQPPPQQDQQQQPEVRQTEGPAQGEDAPAGAAQAANAAGQEVSLMGSRAASIESIEDGELVGARLPSGLLDQPAAELPKPEPTEGQGGLAADGPPTAVPTPAVPLAEAAVATEDVEMGSESGFEAEDAAAALQHLAALPSAAWQDGGSAGEDSEGDGGWAPGRKRRAVRAPSRGPPERKQRKQRPAKLWCRYPLDDERWALILSQSAISSRQISLPWTQPGDMACELLGTSWVEAVRRRTQSGTVRATAALLLEGDDGERQVSYALYQNTGASQKETRPQYIEKLHPVLQSRSASVGDVLLLRPMGPGRLHAQLVKSSSEEAQAVHAALGFDAPSEQQAWQSKHPSRQPSRASSQHDLSQLEASPGAAAAAAGGAAELALAGAAPLPPAATAAAEARQPSPGPQHAAPRQEHVSPAAKAATAAAYLQAVEQAAAADAVDEMLPHHKRPKWEHPDGSPQAAPAAPAPAPGREVHRKPSGLSALLHHPTPMAAPPPLPPAQQEQLRRAAMQQQIAMVSAAQRQAHALNRPGSVQRPPAAAGVVDTMTMRQTQLAMLQQYRTRLKEGSKEHEECSAHIAALQQSMQHLSKFAARPAAGGAAAAQQPPARPAAGVRPAAASTSLQHQMQQKGPAPRPPLLPARPPGVPVLPKPAAALPARPPGQPPAAMRQVQVMAALQSFAAGVAVRVPPGEEHRQHVNERLQALANQLDALLKGFWQQQGPK